MISIYKVLPLVQVKTHFSDAVEPEYRGRSMPQICLSTENAHACKHRIKNILLNSLPGTNIHQ
jgi:hypothetical protein